MVPIVEEEHPARAARQEKGQERHVRLGCVAVAAGKDEVVGPVIGRLAPARTHMIERDRVGVRRASTIGAHGAVLSQKPVTVGLVRAAA
jgi:hypothetical protein